MLQHTTDAAPVTRLTTGEGYVLGRAAIATEGVTEYRRGELGLDGDPDATVRVRRTRETIHHPRTIESLRMRPVTMEHPEKWPPHGTARQIGSTGETVSAKDGTLFASVAVHGADAIARLKDGVDQVSGGYTWTLEPSAEDGIDYASAGPMIFNHVALVAESRIGPDIRMMDSAAEEKKSMPDQPDRKESAKTADDTAPAGMDAMGKTLDAIMARLDAMGAKAAKAEDAASAEAEFQKRVKEAAQRRARIIAGASKFLDADALSKLESASDKEILVAAVADSVPSAEHRPEEYLLGVLEQMARTKADPEPAKPKPETMKAADAANPEEFSDFFSPPKRYTDYVKTMDFRTQQETSN